jgi:hypothetical protein
MSQNVIPILRVFFELVKSTLDLMILFAKSGIGQTSVALTALAAAILGTYISFKGMIALFEKLSRVALKTTAVTTAMERLNITAKATTTSMGIQAVAMQNLRTLFTVLTASIKASIAASLSFIATPMGAALLAIGVVIAATVLKWKNYEKTITNTLKEQEKVRGLFQGLADQMKVYSKVLDKYDSQSAEATEKNKELRESLKKLSEETGIVGDTAKKLIIELDKTSGSTLETQRVLNSFADDLENHISVSLQESALAAEQLYLQQKKMKDGYKSGKEFVEFWTGQTALKTTYNYLDQITRKAGEFAATPFKGLLQYFGLMRTDLEQIAWELKTAEEVYKEMGKEAVAGNKKAESAHRLLTRAAKETTEQLLSQLKVTEMTEEAITKMAWQHATANNYSQQHTGALIVAMREYHEAAKAAEEQAIRATVYAKSIFGVGEMVKKNIEKMKAFGETAFENYTGNLEQMEESFYQYQISELKKAEKEIQTAREQDIENANRAYAEKLSSLGGSLEEAKQLRTAHELHVKQLLQASKEHELMVLKEKRRIYLEHYEQAINDFSENQNIRNDIFNTENQKQVDALERQYQKELALLDQYEQQKRTVYIQGGYIEASYREKASQDEEKLFLRRVQLQKDYYTQLSALKQKQFSDEIAHLEALNQEQIKFANETIEDERELKAEVHKLNKENLTNQIEALTKRKEEYGKTIDELINLEKSLTDAIKKAEKEKEDLRKSAEEVVREVEYAYLNEAEIRYREEQRLAKEASEVRRLLAVGDTQLAKEKAKELAQEYENLMRKEKSNFESLKNSSDSLERYGQKRYEAEEKMLEYRNKYLSAVKLAEEAINRNASAIDGELAKVREMISSQEEGYKQIEQNMVDLSNQLSEMTSQYQKEVSALLSDLDKQIDGIKNIDISDPMQSLKRETESTITVVERLVRVLKEAARQIAANKQAAASSGSGSGSGYSTGGKIPGYGGGDRRNIVVEDGEFVVRKEAVKKYGESLLYAINNMRLPKFSGGGSVSKAVRKGLGSQRDIFSGLKDFGKVVIDTGSASFPAMAHVDVISELNKHLTKVRRFSS